MIAMSLKRLEVHKKHPEIYLVFEAGLFLSFKHFTNISFSEASENRLNNLLTIFPNHHLS